MDNCSTKVAERLIAMMSEQVLEIVGGSKPKNIAEMETKVGQAIRQTGKAWMGTWLDARGEAKVTGPAVEQRKALVNILILKMLGI